VNAKKENLREIFGILLSLLVIAAFLIIAFSMIIPRAKDVGALLTSMNDNEMIYRCKGGAGYAEKSG